MNVQLLIDAVVRQTTVLIAQLATAGGVRAPLAHVANQVFVELAAELERQGLSRKVTADMFGISLRSYQRKVQRLRESRTDHGRSMWEAVLEYLGASGVVTRAEVLSRFHRDPEAVVGSMLHDLVDSGLVFCSGSGQQAVYRVASADELSTLRRRGCSEGLTEFVWAHVYRHGPIGGRALSDLVGLPPAQLLPLLKALLDSGRISHADDDATANADPDAAAPESATAGLSGRYMANQLVIDSGAAHGWEASMYDHFQALVSTMCAKLDPESGGGPLSEYVGGSTYSFDIGPDHPLRDAVLGTLAEFRQRCTELRRRVNEHNQQASTSSSAAAPTERVVVYAGQTVFCDHPTGLQGE